MASQKSITLFTQWFDPEPTFKGMVFARELKDLGFEVHVVTGFPNYPGGIVYDGYKIRLFQKENIDGINVIRLPLYPSHDKSKLGRIANYLSFAFTSLVYLLFFARNLTVIYAYHPPLTIGVVASIVRLFRKVSVVYDIQDLWPDTLKSTGMIGNPKALKVIDAVCNWVYKRVDRIVVLSPGFKRILIERGVPETKIDIIYNWCAEDQLSHSSVDTDAAFPVDGKFRILFAGNMGLAQALQSVIDAAKLLQDNNSRIEFVFLGGGLEVDNLKLYSAKVGCNNVQFLPQVGMDKVGNYLSSADALLVHLRKDPLFEITIPSKTQAYLAVGKPILMAVSGDAANLVKSGNCGLVAESQNATEIASAASDLSLLSPKNLEQMGANGKAFYNSELALSVGASKFAKIFEHEMARLR